MVHRMAITAMCTYIIIIKHKHRMLTQSYHIWMPNSVYTNRRKVVVAVYEGPSITLFAVGRQCKETIIGNKLENLRAVIAARDNSKIVEDSTEVKKMMWSMRRNIGNDTVSSVFLLLNNFSFESEFQMMQ